MYRIEIDFLNDRRPRALQVRADTAEKLSVWREQWAAARDVIAEDIRLQLGLLWLAGGLLSCVGLLAWQGTLQWQKAQMLHELGDRRPKVQRALALKDRLDNARRETTDLNRVFEQSALWYGLLNDLARRTPENIQLTRVQEKDGTLTIQGRAGQYPTIVQFLQNLRGASYMDNRYRIAIDSAKEVSEEYQPMGATPPSSEPVRGIYIEFSLSGRLRNFFPATTKR